MLILGIDPGTTKSAWVLWDDEDEKILEMGICENMELRNYFSSVTHDDLRFLGCHVAIEMVASYGMPVGKEVFETCVWIGVFLEALMADIPSRHFVYRKEVKLNFCGSVKAKDANIRQALIDRFGDPGTKKAPGKLHGVSKDIWSALAVAVTFSDLRKQLNNQTT